MRIILALLFISFCGCNSKRNTHSEKVNNSDSIDQANFYNIKYFMSFDSTTTTKFLTSFLEKRKIAFLINPDFKSLPDLQINIASWKGCPYAHYIYVPKLQLEEFEFKGALFVFYNNYLANITINETFKGVPQDNTEGDLFKLRTYYVKKYGDLIPSVDSSLTFISKDWFYKNQKDSIEVRFSDVYLTSHEFLNGKETVDHSLIHIFSIIFPSQWSLNEKCREYFAKESEKSNREKKEKEKTILDKL